MLQYAYPRRPDYTFRIYEGGGQRAEQVAFLRRLAQMLDSKYRLPGGLTIGWDGILGFIPVLGDLATNAISLFVLVQAALLGAPPAILARMGINLLIDNALDAVPILGNFADFVWKANNRNVAILDAYLADPRRAVRRSRWVVGFSVAAVVLFAFAVLTLGVIAAVAAVRWISQGLGGW